MLITLNIGFYFLLAEFSSIILAAKDSPEAFFKKLVLTADNELSSNCGLKNSRLMKKVGAQLKMIPVPKDYVWSFVVFGTKSKATYDMDPKFPADKTTVRGKPEAFVRYRLGFGGRNYLLVAGPKYKKEEDGKVFTAFLSSDRKNCPESVSKFKKVAHGFENNLNYIVFLCAKGNAKNVYHGANVSVERRNGIVRTALF